jgi:hypothetical protein
MKTPLILIATTVALFSGAFVHEALAYCCADTQPSAPAPTSAQTCFRSGTICEGECYMQDSAEEVECTGTDPLNQCNTDECEEQDVDYYDGKPSCIPNACQCTIPAAPTGTVKAAACLAKCEIGA